MAFGNPALSLHTRSQIYKTDYGYIHRRPWLDIVDTHIDLKGNILRVDSIKYPLENVNEVKFNRTQDDTLRVIVYDRIKDFKVNNIILGKYDKDMNLVQTYNLAKYIKDSISLLGFLIGEDGTILLQRILNNSSDKSRTISTYMISNSGGLIDESTYNAPPSPIDKRIYRWDWPLADIINKRVLTCRSERKTPTGNTFFTLLADQSDTLKIIKKIEVEGNKDHFVFRYAHMMDNGDILLYVSQITDPSIIGVRWYSWIMLDGKKMNIISSTKDEPSVHKTFNLYPNPTSAQIKIDGLLSPATVTIKNINGQVLNTLTSVVTEVDISNLPSGMYIFDIRNKDVSEIHKIIKLE